MTKQDKNTITRLEKMVEAESERADLAWGAYKLCISQLVEARAKLTAIENAMKGE